MSKGAPLHFLPLLPMPRLAIERAFEAALDEIYLRHAIEAKLAPISHNEPYWQDVGVKLARLRACAEGETI